MTPGGGDRGKRERQIERRGGDSVGQKIGAEKHGQCETEPAHLGDREAANEMDEAPDRLLIFRGVTAIFRHNRGTK